MGPELVYVELSCKSHKGLANLKVSGLRNEEVVKLDKYVGRRVKRKQLAISRSSYTHVTRKNAIYQETFSFCQSLTVHYTNSVNNIKLKLGLHELIAP